MTNGFGFGVGVQRLGSVGVATRAALLALPLPGAGIQPTGYVYNDPDPAKNGVYTIVSGAWVRQRGLPEQFARLNVTGGSEDHILATAQDGVDLSQAIALIIKPVSTNISSDVTINGKVVKNAFGNNLAAGEFHAGRTYLLVADDPGYRVIVGEFATASQGAIAESAMDLATAATDELFNTVVNGPLLSQKKLMEPFFGFDNGTLDNQIYANSQFAIQGHCIVDTPDGPILFVSQRTQGATWDTDERCRIASFALLQNGSVGMPIAFSPELQIGHGANLSGIYQGGQVILFCSASPSSGSTMVDGGGKGYTKIVWEGAATDQSHVTTYRPFANAGLGARDIYRYATAAVSEDGKHVALVARNSGDTGRFLFIFDRAAIEAAADPTLVAPITGPVVLSEGLGEFGGTLQGLAVDSKRIVYSIWGVPAPRSIKTINMHDYGGVLRRQIVTDGPASQYTEAQLNYHSTLKFPASFEPEGLFFYKGKIITGWVDSWRDAPVVTYKGKNYACIATTSLGVYPGVGRGNWLPTTRPATAGTFDPTVTYNGGNYTRRSKMIFAISATDTDLPVSTGKSDPAAGARVVAVGGAPDLTFSYGSTFQINARVEGLNLNIPAYYVDGSTHRFYAVSLDYSGYFGSVSRVKDDVNDYLAILGNGTVLGSSTYILMYGSTDANNPNEVRISSLGTAFVRLMVAGITKLSISATENVSYQVLRALNHLAIDLGTATRAWLRGWFGQLALVDGVTAPTTEAGYAVIYVDSADGDLKIKFGDGTVKTIVVDT